MTKDQMKAAYDDLRRYGTIEWDYHPSCDVRVMRIRSYRGMSNELIQVALYAGEVFAITKVTE